MNKCVYCHREIRELRLVTVGKEQEPLACCGEDCARGTLQFYRFFERTKAVFLAGITVSMALLFAGVILLSMRRMQPGAYAMGAAMSLLGLIILLFPFATPQTFNLLGIRKTVWFVRLLGVAIIALGPLTAYWLMT